MARRPERSSLSLIAKRATISVRARKNAMPANKIIVDLFYRQALDSHHLDLLAKFLRSFVEQSLNGARRVFDEGLIEKHALLDKAVEFAVERFLTIRFRHVRDFFFKHRSRCRGIRIRHLLTVDPNRVH